MDPIRSALLTANRRRYEDGGAPAVRAPSPVTEAAPLREPAAPPADKAPAISEADIQNLYKTTKGIEREADPSGLSYWMDQAKGGMSLDQMQQAFNQAAQDPVATAQSDTMKSTGAVASFGDNPPVPPTKPLYLQNFDYSQYDNPLDARYAYLSKTLNPTIAAAMMGNYGVESFNNPNQLQTKNGLATGTPIFDKNNMPTGYGAAMWGKERLTNPNAGQNKMGLFDFADAYGFDPNSTEGQDRFAVYELTQNPEYAGTYKDLLSAGTNVNKATQIFGDQYENPANLSASLGTRQTNAGLFQNYYSNPSSLSAADQAKIAQTKSGMFDPAFQKYAADKATADKATQLAKTPMQTVNDPMMDTVAATNITQPMGIGNDALSQQLNANQGTDFSNLGATGMNPYNMNTTFSSSGAQDNNQNGISIMNGMPDWYSPYAHGGVVGHVLRLAHHYATGGYTPAQPDHERALDRINRMLTEKPEVDPATQDWSARRTDYLQSHPGQQIRDRSFARGGYADGGDAESVLMQEAQFDPMGNVAVPPQAPEGAKPGGYDRFMQSFKQPEDSRILEGMKQGFGDQPFGGPRFESDYAKHPVLGDIYKSVAFPAEAAMRIPGAIVGGAAGAATNAYEAMGADPSDVNKFQRDLNVLGNTALIEAGRPRMEASRRILLPTQVEELGKMYQEAATRKPAFDQVNQQIASDLGGKYVGPGLKGRPRATEKTIDDYGGNPRGLKDLLRGTIAVDTPEQAQAAITALKNNHDVLPSGYRNLFDPSANPVDGYRDAKMNVNIGGHVAEIQVNLPEMLQAKKQVHNLYEERRTIEGNWSKREATPAELERTAQLNSQMKAVYDAAYARALDRSSRTNSLNRSNDIGDPFLRADSAGKARGGSLSQAALPNGTPSTLPRLTGMPSTSKYSGSFTGNTSAASIGDVSGDRKTNLRKFGPEAAQRAVQIAKQQAGRR